ncbi:MAG: cell division protein FtsZ, partial [Spirochaetia bacterium]|nr:cell division protein FtsZ [Spirochaetia bacterium]
MNGIAFEKEGVSPTVIKVVGVGGGGCNAVNRMVLSGLTQVDFVAINTDMQALSLSKAKVRIQIGKKTTMGLGSGADPERGRLAAEEDEESIRQALRGADMVFITAGMGKGTGTGASPIVARVAKELGCLTVAIVTKPFGFEGGKRMTLAERGIAELSEHVDTLIVIANNNLFLLADKKLQIPIAFEMADSILMQGVRGIAEIITKPGIMNVD